MLTKEQAEAAAETLLYDKRAEQAALREKIQRRKLVSRRWVGAGTLLGFAAGGLVGYYVTGRMLPWNLLGMAIGMTIGLAWDRYAA